MKRTLTLSTALSIATILLAGCSQSNAPQAPVEVSAHTFPSDPKAAGWDKTAALFDSSIEAVMSDLNRKQDEAFAKLEVGHAVPVEKLHSSESLAPEVLSSERTAFDRSQDRDENEWIDTDQLEEQELGARKQGSKKQPKGGGKPRAKAPSQPADLSWDSILSEGSTRGIELGTSIAGPQPLARKDTRPFIPASIVKSISVARGLEVLGPDYRFGTKFRWNDVGNGVAVNMTVIGSGDPTIGSNDFKDGDLGRIKKIISQMKEAGVKEVRGSIKMVSADVRWDQTVHAPGVESGDFLQCFGALSQAFNVASNCATIQVTPDAQANLTAKWTMPEITVPIQLNLQPGSSSATSVRPVLDRDGHIKAYAIEGTWNRKRKAPLFVRLPVPDSKNRLRNIISRELKAVGIAHKPNEYSPDGGTPKQLVMASPKLSEIIVPLLKESDNFLADAVFKRAALSYPNKRLPLREAAQKQLADGIAEWTQAAGFPHMKDELLLLDGAGLSRSNRATPRAYLALMKTIARKPFFTALWRGLPIAGIDGTLKNRLSDRKTRGLLRAKTGTVRGCYQLSGFMPDYNEDASVKAFVPFVILSSTSPGNRFRVFSLQQRLLSRLANVLNPTFTPKQIPRT